MRPDVACFAGEPVHGVRVFGQEVDVWVRPIEPEIERRRAAAIGAVTDATVLRALMDLPEGFPVALVDIDPLMRMVLDGLDERVVEVRADHVVRRLSPPVGLTGLVKHATVWEDVQAATLLRTHAPRLVVAPPELARRVVQQADPDLGVAEANGEVVTIRRSPGRRWLCPSWQRWMTAETAYAAWVAGASAAAAARRRERQGG
jgi:hypothetical protein